MHLLLQAVAILLHIGVSLTSQDGACRKPLTCVTLSECTMTHHRHNSDISRDIIFDCGGTGSTKARKVCCPPVRPTRIKPPSVANRQANMKLLPTADCGLVTTDRIIGGENATLGQFPWMALLGYKVTGNPVTQYLCGGTMISNRYILTAAHCVTTAGLTVESVRLGELNLASDQDCFTYDDTANLTCSDPVRDVGVEKVIIHPNYGKPTLLKNDIALIRLKSPVASTDFVRPICLPFGVNITGAEEKKYFIAGWGKENARKENGSQMLKFARISSSSIEDCNALQEKRVVHVLTETQLCAGGNTGEDACKGDSGGPLMDARRLPNQDSAQWVQFGIVSFGLFDCGSDKAPSVYTRVTAYLDWILDSIAK